MTEVCSHCPAVPVHILTHYFKSNDIILDFSHSHGVLPSEAVYPNCVKECIYGVADQELTGPGVAKTTTVYA